MRNTAILPLLSLVTLVAASGCGKVATETGESRASLRRAQSCEDLGSELRADLRAKLNGQIDSMISAIRDCQASYGGSASECAYGYYGFTADRGSDDFAAGSGSSSGSSNSPGSSSGDSSSPPPTGENNGGTSSSGGGAGSPSDPDFTDTNTQVQGVDEADIVKTDGKTLYVLHGSTLRILNAWPLDTLSERASVELEGNPTEMYLTEGAVVVFSQVDGAPIYQAAGVQPPSDHNGSGGVRPDYGYGGDYAYYTNPLTKITVLQLQDGGAVVRKESYLEGSYLSSRRVGDQVRTVLQGQGSDQLLQVALGEATERVGGYEAYMADPIGVLERVRGLALARIDAADTSGWLPRAFDKQGDSVSARSVACSDAYTPTAGTTESGSTTVSALDLGDLGANSRETTIFGRTDTVYGNADKLYLAAHAWVNQPWGSGGSVGVGGATDTPTAPPSTGSGTGGSPGSSSGWSGGSSSGSTGSSDVGTLTSPRSGALSRASLPDVITLNFTHLHEFTFDGDGAPSYQASGTVPGNVLNQFSLDERDGSLRVATTETRGYRSDYEGTWTDRPRSLTHLFTLHRHEGELAIQGAVKDLAPDERIYSVRYVGNRGYVVTFRQVDPLFVIDLANPAAPTLLGELKIPGFSEYMHPLDDNHLLTIGRDATDSGQVQGLALQIFDVTQGNDPKLVQKFVYNANSYGYSEAQSNHKAFTYFADRQLLAFPYTSYDTSDYRQRSTLELFRVSKEQGFSRLGAIDHSALFTPQEPNGCHYIDPTVRRGLFIENVAYSVSYGGVVAKRLDALDGDGVSVALPAPWAGDKCDGYGNPGDVDGGTVDGGEAPQPND